MTLRTSALVLVCLLSVSASVAGSDAPADAAQPFVKAPDIFEAKFETSIGDFVIEVNRAWAPSGADRFYNLVKSGHYDNLFFFPVVPGYAVQFGVNSDDAVLAQWKDQNVQIQDDPVKESNKAGLVTFAKGGHNSPATQVFVNLGDNSRLDSQGFAPFGKVTRGMEVVAALNREIAVASHQMPPKTYKLDFIRNASVVEEPKE